MTQESANHPRSVGGFVGGVLVTQFVNSALHLAQPLLIADLTGSMGHAAFFSSFDTAMHMCGTYFSGWPVDKFGARRVLVLATFLRGLALAAIPIMMLTDHITVLAVMIWYTIDALVRGFVDAAVYTLPLELVAHDAKKLDQYNSRFELAFEFGGIVGPLALGGFMLWFPGIVAHAVIPLGFVVSAGLYALIPRRLGKPGATPASASETKSVRGGTWQGLKTVLKDRRLALVCLSYTAFNIYPLRKLLSAFFAKSLLVQPAAAGVVGAAFGIGGLIGAVIYSRWGTLLRLRGWMRVGALGLLILAVGWIPASLAVMAGAAAVFAFSNVVARLSLIRARQERTPMDLSGGVTAVSRFAANLVSVLSKALLGAAFAWGASPQAAFSLVAVILALLALAQIILAKRPEIV